MMTTLILYSRPDCHLCDEAAELLALTMPGRTFETVDIEDDLRLIDRYGIRVPVLRLEPSGAELGWPFDGEQLMGFLKEA